MVENAEMKMDALLKELAQDVERGTPRPGPDLMARVLADAAEVAAARPQATADKAAASSQGFSIIDFLLGWTTGAVAAMAVALVLGIGVGMQMEPGDLPYIMEDEDMLTMSDGGFLPEDVL